MALPVRRINLGSQGLEVSALGLSCMGMTPYFDPPNPRADMINLIHHAVQRGITFLDTSDIRASHGNEMLLGEALEEWVEPNVELATKFGISFAGGKRVVRGDPPYVRTAVGNSLKHLGVDCIALYYQHRVDPHVPIEDTVWILLNPSLLLRLSLSHMSRSVLTMHHHVVESLLDIVAEINYLLAFV